MRSVPPRRVAWCVVALLSLGASPAAAWIVQTKAAPTSAVDLDRRVADLEDQLAKIREGGVTVAKPGGGAPIAGYGEFHFERIVSDRGQGDVTGRARIPNFALMPSAAIGDATLHAEITVEDLTQAGGRNVDLTAAALDVPLVPGLGVRTGLLLMPVGFINEAHRPQDFHGNLRPMVEGTARLNTPTIIPATWSELGIGLYGDPAPNVHYRAYIVPGLRAARFSPIEGWRPGRQGPNGAFAGDLGIVGRVDYDAHPTTTVGASLYWGGSDQGEFRAPGTTGMPTAAQLSVWNLLVEGHADVHAGGLVARALVAYGKVQNAAALTVDRFRDSEAIGSSTLGYYLDVGYDVMPLLQPTWKWRLVPWFRYEKADTQASISPMLMPAHTKDPRASQQWIEVGVDLRPHPQWVVKLEYVNRKHQACQAAGGGPCAPPLAEPVEDSLLIGAGYSF